MLLRLAYLGVTNVFAVLRLLPVSSRDKDAEILVLRHHFSVLQRQLGPGRARFTPGDRALLAALLHLWVPKTRATWPDALLAAGHPAPRQAHVSPVLACRGVG